MITLFITIGLPGSGKSHWASEQDAKVVSSDAIREELFGDVNDQNHNNEVFNEVHNRIQISLRSEDWPAPSHGSSLSPALSPWMIGPDWMV